MRLDNILSKEVLVKTWPIAVGIGILAFAAFGPDFDPTSSTLRRRRRFALRAIYELFGEAGVKVAMVVIGLVLLGVGVAETRKALQAQNRKR